MADEPVTAVALGVRVAVHVEDEPLHGALSAALADLRPGHTAGVPTQTSDVVRIDVAGAGPFVVASGEQRTTVSSRSDALAHALAVINGAAVMAPRLLTCHAAVLTRDATTLVLPGPSGRGKTTLTAALLLQGWAYVSDEALALPWGPAPPWSYPRPLSLSAWSQAALDLPDGLQAGDERLYRPSDLGAGVAREIAPVSEVVLARRADSPGRPALTALHRQDALKELLARGFTSPTDPARALTVLAGVLEQARVHAVDVGRPRETASMLSRLLAAP